MKLRKGNHESSRDIVVTDDKGAFQGLLRREDLQDTRDGGILVGMIEGIVALYVQAAVARIALFGLFVVILFVRPSGLLGVERR